MKRLMLLGGSRYILPVTEAAHKIGVYVITCDYLPDNIAHKYSDEYHNVSIIDKEKVLELARNLKIDGIMSFACDPGVVTAAYVAEQMGLPFQGSYESVSILQDKGKFRKFLMDNGFNCPYAQSYRDKNAALRDIDKFRLPVIVKPVDSAGSKGVTRVDKAEDLPGAIDVAINKSIVKSFIIEEFIEQKGFSSDTDCFSINGKLVFTSFNNQMFDKKAANPYTPAAYSWPSYMPDNIQSELKSELQRLITLLNMGTTLYNVETRQGMDGKAYIMELTPRGGGNRLSEVLQMATGTDLITNAVRAAIGEKVQGIIGDPQYKGYWAEIILHTEKGGTFENLWISPEIKDNVAETDLWILPGTKINGFTGANEAIGTLVLKFDDRGRMDKVMCRLSEFVKINVY